MKSNTNIVLEGLTTTEWWMLLEQIKAVNITTHGHRMDGPIQKMAIADQSGQLYELDIDLANGSIFEPDKVRKVECGLQT